MEPTDDPPIPLRRTSRNKRHKNPYILGTLAVYKLIR
jgi:hypothetical protein